MLKRRARRLLLGFAVLLAAAACSPSHPAGGGDTERHPAASPSMPASASPPRIVALGDSLTAGYGISKEEAYPALLQKRLEASGLAYEVVNAGVSGDTTAGGLSRLDWSLDGNVRVLIVALGANDGLRGLPVAEMRRNLSAIVERAQQRHITVLLVGMEALTNMGPQYQRAFHDVFPSLASQYHLAFMPFLLEGVAGRPELNQPDGVHPTAQGARVIADNIWPVLEPLLETR